MSFQPSPLAVKLAVIVLGFELVMMLPAAMLMFSMNISSPAVYVYVAAFTLGVLGAIIFRRKQPGVVLGWLTQIIAVVGAMFLHGAVLLFTLVFAALWIFGMLAARRHVFSQNDSPEEAALPE